MFGKILCQIFHPGSSSSSTVELTVPPGGIERRGGKEEVNKAAAEAGSCSGAEGTKKTGEEGSRGGGGSCLQGRRAEEGGERVGEIGHRYSALGPYSYQLSLKSFFVRFSS